MNEYLYKFFRIIVIVLALLALGVAAGIYMGDIK